MIKRGDIYYADLDPVVGSEQGDKRPVLVVQNDIGNKHSPTIVVTPITCNLQKKRLPTHVIIPQRSGLAVDSLALVEQIRTIDRIRLGEYIGRIGGKVQEKIDNALAVSVGIDEALSKKTELLTLCLCPRCESDFWDSGCALVKKGWQQNKQTCDFCGVKKGFVFGILGRD
jgi:mRNA interferase MazF